MAVSNSNPNFLGSFFEQKEAATSAYLPPELVLEILCRLPIHSLVKCTSVCKRWYSTITSPDFISTHLNFSLSNSNLLIRSFSDTHLKEKYFLYSTDGARIATIDFPFYTLLQLFFRVVGTLHGLICLSDDVFAYTDVIIIWNPFVQRFVNLPPPLFDSDSFGGSFMFMLGFGYDSKKNDYKVIKLASPKDKKGLDGVPLKVEIYSIKERSWRAIDAVGVDVWVGDLFGSQCFLNGNVHWISSIYKGKRLIDNSILVFNVEEERFSKMELPEELNSEVPLGMFISLIQGCVSVFYCCTYHEENLKCCHVWLMKTYGDPKSWTRVCSFDLKGGVGKIIGTKQNGENVVVPGATLVSFHSLDLKAKEMRDLNIRRSPEALFTDAYTQSLVLLDKESGAIPFPGSKSCVKWKMMMSQQLLIAYKKKRMQEFESL